MHSNGSMNRVYRLVWNASTGVWQAVCECSKGRGKTKSGKSRAISLSCLLAGAFVVLPLSALAADLPTGGNIVAGSGAISQTGQNLTVTQTSAKLAADWQSFNIGAGNTVNFVQPSASAVALNRVLGAEVSVIQGALKANGQVFLVNPNGVLFTPTAQVNVGALVASTLNLSTDDFLAGNYRFSGNSQASVTNQGDIHAAQGGAVALIAARIDNTGSITAPQGNILMGAGKTVRLDLGGKVKLEVQEGALNTLIEQGGAIRADGGLVYLTAKAAGDLASSVINHSGITQARTLSTGEQGEILLMGDMAQGTTKVGGTLDASAPNGGNGGFIETSAARVKVADPARINTRAADGQAGTWLIDPQDFTIASGNAGTVTGDTPSGDISGATLSTALGSSNVTILSSQGSNASGNGDINVNDTVSWSANLLTLTASRDININAVMTASGISKLAMNTATTNGGNEAVTSGTVKVGMLPNGGGFKGRVDFPGRSGADILTIGGSGYTVISALGAQGSTTQTDVQGMNGNRGGRYALGSNIDASSTSGWSAGEGFLPIGISAIKFTGTFDGLGHTVNGLTINRSGTDHVGLFGYTSYAAIRNIGVVGGSISGNGNVGGLIGNNNNSTITNAYATGAVSSSSLSVGGLIGANSNSTITNAYATGAVSSSSSSVGGLIGFSGLGTISGVYATGTVSSSSTTAGAVGGLIGNSASTLTNAYASGAVSGPSQVGGLIGNSNGAITNAYASGSVIGSVIGSGNFFGGLVGYKAGGSLTNVFATGTVSGFGYVGGLAGRNQVGSISNAYATGAVTGTSDRGSLIGSADTNGNSADTVYATGTVNGGAGTLVGSGPAATNVVNLATVATNDWTGTAGDGLWTTADNWSGGHVPTIAETAVLGANSVSIPSIVLAKDVTATTGAALTFTGPTVSSLAIGQGTSVTLGAAASDVTLHYGTAGKLNLTGTGPLSFKLNGTTYTVIQKLGVEGSSTGKDLQGMGMGKYVLGLDIDASATSGWNSGDGFKPIAALFRGVFDGLGHSINDLFINRSTTDEVGLFASINGFTSDAIVRNVGLAGGSITGQNQVGGLVGATLGTKGNNPSPNHYAEITNGHLEKPTHPHKPLPAW